MTNDFIAGTLAALCLRLAFANLLMGMLAAAAIGCAYFWADIQPRVLPLAGKAYAWARAFASEKAKPCRKFRGSKILVTP